MEQNVRNKISVHFFRIISVIFISLCFIFGTLYVVVEAYDWSSGFSLVADVDNWGYYNRRGGFVIDSQGAVMVTYHNGNNNTQYVAYTATPESPSWQYVAVDTSGADSGYGENSMMEMHPDLGYLFMVYIDVNESLDYAWCDANFDASNCLDPSDWNKGNIVNALVTGYDNYIYDMHYDDVVGRWGLLRSRASTSVLYLDTVTTPTGTWSNLTTANCPSNCSNDSAYVRSFAIGSSSKIAISTHGVTVAPTGYSWPIVKYTTNGGSSWNYETFGIDSEAQYVPGTDLEYDSDGDLIVVFSRPVSAKLRWDSWQYNGSSWSFIESVYTAGGNGYYGSASPRPSLIKKPDGDLSLAYFSSGSAYNGILYREWDGSSWSSQETVKSLCDRCYGTFHAVGQNGGIAIGYNTEVTGYLYMSYAPPVNSAPTVLVPGAIQTSATIVTVTTTIADIDENITSSTFQYSTNGTDWTNATIGNVTQDEVGDGVVTSPGSISGIDTQSDTDNSVDLTIEWMVSTDLPDTTTNTVQIRMTPNDGTVDGTTQTSLAFAIDTAAPSPAPGALTVNTTSTDSVILNLGTTSTDSNFQEYKVFYKTGSSGVTESDTAFTSSSVPGDTDLSDSNFNATSDITISGLSSNTQYVANIWAYDTYSNTASSTSEIAFYTLAPVPTNVATSSVATSSVSFSVDTFNNHNSASSSYFFNISLTAGDVFVSSSGWQAGDNTWSVDSLSPYTQYTIGVAYRNGDGIGTTTTTLNFYTLDDTALVPSISSLTAESSTSLSLIVNENGNASTTTYLVHDSIDNTFLQADFSWDTAEVWHTFLELGEASGISSTGLLSNTEHTVEVKAKNQSGETTAYGSSQNAFTLANIPSAATLSVTSTSAMDLILGLNSNPTSTEYSICTTSNGSSCDSDGYVQADGTLGTTEIWRSYELWDGDTGVAISDLSPSTGYRFLAKARNGDNTESSLSSASNQVYTYTTTPTSLSATAAGTLEINVSWSGNGLEYYAENTTEGTNSGWITSASWSSTDLQASTNYNFRVQARNGDSVTTTWSGTVAGRTLDAGGGTTIVIPPDCSQTNTCPQDADGSVFINAGASQVESKEVTLTISSDLATHYYEPFEVPYGEACATDQDLDQYPLTNGSVNTPFVFSEISGNKTVCVKFYAPSASNVVFNRSANIELLEDLLPGSARIVIDEGAKYTKNRQVKVDLTAPTAELYRVSEDPLFVNKLYKNKNPYAYTNVSSGDGEKTVYVQFKEGEEEYVAQDSIILDQTKPILFGDTIVFDSGVELATLVREQVVTGKVWDNYLEDVEIKFSLWNISRGSYNAPTPVWPTATKDFFTTPDAEGNFSYSFPFVLEHGKYTFTVWATDGAGNQDYVVNVRFIVPEYGETCDGFPPEIIMARYAYDTAGHYRELNLDGTAEMNFIKNSDLAIHFDVNSCPLRNILNMHINDNSFSEDEGISFYKVGGSLVNEGFQGPVSPFYSQANIYDRIYTHIKDSNDPISSSQSAMHVSVADMNTQLALSEDDFPQELYFRFVATTKGVSTVGDEIKVSVTEETLETYCEKNPTDPICIQDWDKDLVLNLADNCPNTKNGNCTENTLLCDANNDGVVTGKELEQGNQLDSDSDGLGDVCDPDEKDYDLDEVLDMYDNCPYARNGNCTENPLLCDANKDGVVTSKELEQGNQLDSDGDELGDVCDLCDYDAENDIDGDGLCADKDNCPNIYNKLQEDFDENGIGDSCDVIDDFVCGNDIVEPGESCDGSAPEGYYCNSSCNLIVIEPVAVCGNGIIEENETCDDGNNTNGDGCSASCTKEGDDGGDDDDGTIVDIIIGGIIDIIDSIVDFGKRIIKKIIDIIPEPIKEFVRKITEIIQKIIDNPVVERLNEIVVVPFIATAGIANIAIGFQLPNIFAFLRYLFGQPLLAFRRRKQKKWGVIYDAFTKQAVSLATIRVIDIAQDKAVRSQVTDGQGRYYIILDPGKYRLEVIKPGFSGFSEYLKNKNEDAKYINLYHGEEFEITEDNGELNYNIPLDAEAKSGATNAIIKDYTHKLWHYGIGLSGVIITAVSFIISPNIIILAFFFLHLIFFGVAYQFGHKKMAGGWGTVTVENTIKKVSKVIVRVFDSEYNKLVGTGVTDRKGRYAILVGPSTYYATYEKGGFKEKKSDNIDLSSRKTDGMGGIIGRDEKLKKKNKGTLIISDTK